MLMYSMGVSTDGFITDRRGEFAWTAPTDEQFQHSLEEVSSLDAYLLGRPLYEAMRVWETEPSFRDTEAHAAFADVWAALPKVVFSRALTVVEGNARLATAPLADEIAALQDAGKTASIGGATLAAQAIQLDLVDEFRILRHPILVGAGTPYFPVIDRDLQLELLETRTFGSPVVYERYGRVR